MDSVTHCVGALREAAAVNVPECKGPELGAASAWNPMRAAESACDGENEYAHAAGSKREDSGLMKRADRATPASGERWADLSDECGEAGWTGGSASRTEPSSVEAAIFREAYGSVGSTSAARIIADAWADLVRNDDGVDKETLREALLDTVRQMVEEVRVEPSPMTTAGKRSWAT